ncbi:CDP-alcohol phosphatidyltransferase family protein [Sphingomonas sp.]|uniref:CDP-alcohol phosphatidyltransferase family protein n=1 Tax=Sphingomonas sp. TaxID=28214 RepID=UPI003B006A57
MTTPPPDGSRDRRIEDPSNRWLIHPAARRLLPLALNAGVSANAVSLAGLLLGTGAALAFSQWDDPWLAVVGVAFAMCWLIADGLDGMIARATGTASAFGRFMDGVCDHGVFALIYLSVAASVGTLHGWLLAVTAGVAHAVQSSLYEGERARFHRRLKGVAEIETPVLSTNPLVRLYDTVAGSLDRLAHPFERTLAASPSPVGLGAAYAAAALAPMRVMVLLTANVRVMTVFLACLIGRPSLFWWAEIVPLTLVTIVGLVWHRRVEQRFAGCEAVVGGRPSSFA